jgi:hypothetical protein
LPATSYIEFAYVECAAPAGVAMLEYAGFLRLNI